MKYRTCPDCGATLDFGEICDCRKKENDTALTVSPSGESAMTFDMGSIPEIHADVKDCELLSGWIKLTGEKNRDVAHMLQDVFPMMSPQLLSQCAHWERYGVIIHPSGLERIAYAYGLDLTKKPKKSNRRRKTRQITFRCSDASYAKIEDLKRTMGLDTDQAFLEAAVAALIKNTEGGST